MAPNATKYLGNFFLKIGHQGLSKIAQSGHTGADQHKSVLQHNRRSRNSNTPPHTHWVLKGKIQP